MDIEKYPIFNTPIFNDLELVVEIFLKFLYVHMASPKEEFITNWDYIVHTWLPWIMSVL